MYIYKAKTHTLKQWSRPPNTHPRISLALTTRTFAARLMSDPGGVELRAHTVQIVYSNRIPAETLSKWLKVIDRTSNAATPSD